MTNKVRRVRRRRDTEEWDPDRGAVVIGSIWETHPNGDHYLVPKEVWERVVGALQKVSIIDRKRTPHLGMVRESGIEKGCIVCIAELALAEIGGGDDR